MAEQDVLRHETADEQAQVERLDRLGLGDEPFVKGGPAGCGDAIELLLRSRPLSNGAARREPAVGKAGEEGIELCLGGRPDVADRLLEALHQVVARALAFDREEREHRGLGGREARDRVGCYSWERTISLRTISLRLGDVNFRVEPATDALFSGKGLSGGIRRPTTSTTTTGRAPLNPERFYSVHTDDGAIAGFYFFAERGGAMFYGLGLRPDLTGRGLGLAFVTAGLDFAIERFEPSRFVLDVAEFNERAIRVYERVGFRRTGTKTRFFEGWGDVPFVDMERPRD